MRTSATRRRTAICAAIAVSLALGTVSASAVTRPKPKPVCYLLKDVKGDADGGALGANEDKSLDILSADVATNTKLITAVIRVVKLERTDVMAPEGTFYEFGFTGSSRQDGHAMYVQLLPTGVVWQGGNGRGVLDYKKNEVRMTLPLSYFGTGASSVVPGPPLHNFIVYADHGNPLEPIPTTLNVLGDSGTSKATYKPGTLSCVPIGK